MPTDADACDSNTVSWANRAVIPVLVTVSPETPVQEAIARMDKAQANCVVITQQQRPVGVFSCQDLARLIASGQALADQSISAVMTPQLRTLRVADIQDIWDIFQQMQQYQLHYFPVVNDQHQLVGLVTECSLLQALSLGAKQPESLEPSAANQAASESCGQKNHADLAASIACRTAELRQAEHRWRTLLEEVQLMVVGINREGKLTYANPFFLKLTGYSAAEAIGLDWFRCFVPPSERPKIYEYFQQLCRQQTSGQQTSGQQTSGQQTSSQQTSGQQTSGQQPSGPSDVPLQCQNSILTQSGAERMIIWHNTVLRDRDDNIIGTISLGEDITERFTIAKMKGEFIAMVSHELRTPLTSLHGGVKLLAQGIVPSQSEQGQHLLQLAVTSSERLVRLVNDVLDLEQLELGKQRLQKQFIQTQALTSQLFDAFQQMGNPKKLALDVCDPGIGIMADGDRLSQVLTHLLDNAMKFSLPNTTIRLTVALCQNEPVASSQGPSAQGPSAQGPSAQGPKAASDTVLFSLCDQGIGIPPEQRDRVFERFAQARYAQAQGGTGLGLTICRNVVEQHGGKIWVESTVGQGSCFCFTVPLQDQ
ncbi:MAG: PAS domain S-box protein [Phormidesmis sp. RL_2_1]|nr:PAS domain S-box protein [Phormidesmis sp. RL_2_1]